MNKWGRHLTFCLEEALPVLHSSTSPGSIIPTQEPVEAVNCEPASGRFVSSRGQTGYCLTSGFILIKARGCDRRKYRLCHKAGNRDTQSWTACEGEWSSLLQCQNGGILACNVDELRLEQALMVKLDLSAIIAEGAAPLRRLNPSERVSSNSLWSPTSGRDAWSDSLPMSYYFFFYIPH